MKTKLTPNVIAAAFAVALTTVPFLFSQTSSALPSPGPATQTQGMNQPAQMDQMATSVTQMAEMCKKMWNKEMATMHYEIAAAVNIAALLTIALVLLIVLEIQCIEHWSQILKGG